MSPVKPQLRVLAAAVLCAAIPCVTACSKKAAPSESTEPAGNESTAPAPAVPEFFARPAAERLPGTFTIVGSIDGRDFVRGWRFTQSEVSRLIDDVEVSREPYEIEDEEGASFVIARVDDNGTVTRIPMRFLSDDRLVHRAAPEVVYQRVPDAAPPEWESDSNDSEIVSPNP